MAERTVLVKLTASIADYRAQMQRAGDSTKTLGTVVKTEADGIGRAGKRAGDDFAAGIAGGAIGADVLTRDILGRLRNSRGQFATDAEKIAAGFGDGLGRGGEKAGGKLAQGINAGLIRNSPVIAAGIAGALTLGAPAVLAAAGVMFGGIGALALKENEEVTAAWSGLGEQLKRQAAADAAVLVPTYVGMAKDIGDAYISLRPQMREAFADTRPLVDSVSDGIIGLTRNALPGLVSAVGNADGAFEGLENLLEDTGTGLGGMFEAISRNGDSAGTVLTAVGDIVEAVLPTLGELVGAGSVLASQILPPVADGLGMVADVAEDLGPLLPALVTGFVGMRVVGGLGGMLTGFATGLSTAAMNAGTYTEKLTGSAAAGERVMSGAGRVSGAVGRVGSAFSSAGAAIPLVGAAVALVASEMSDADAQTSSWTQGIIKGGQAAVDAYAGVAAERAKYGDNWIGDLSYEVDQFFGLASSMEDAQRAAGELWRGMTPLEQATQKQAEWTETLSYRLGEYGPKAEETRIAQERLGYWTGEAADRQAELDAATAAAVVSLSTVPGTTQSAYDSLTTYAQALGLSEEETGQLRTRTEELGASLAEFVNPLGAYTGLLEEKRAAEQASAQTTADATTSTTDSWETYYNQVGVSFDEYMIRLEDQVAAQADWQTNMLILSSRVSSTTIAQLAEMGLQGADLVAQMVTRSDSELGRMDEIAALRAREATDAWGSQLTMAGPVLAAIGRTAGEGVVAELSAQLAAGTTTVAAIAAQYGISLADGINPVLTSLGKQAIVLTGANRVGGPGVVVRYADGGFEDHTAQIAGAGTTRFWAEPETPGSAYIPLAHHRRLEPTS